MEGFSLHPTTDNMVGGPPVWARLSRQMSGTVNNAYMNVRRYSSGVAPPLPEASGPTETGPGNVSRAGTDLMLLLLRHGVPNSEIFAAKTDREMALLAQKHGIALPQHLSHLPTLPLPRSATEKARLEAAMAAAEAEIEGESALKERPPRKARLGLLDVKFASFSKGRGAPAPEPSPPPSTRPVGAPPPSSSGGGQRASAAPMDEGYLTGTAVKEAAPSVRRKKKAKEKKGAGKSKNSLAI